MKLLYVNDTRWLSEDNSHNIGKGKEKEGKERKEEKKKKRRRKERKEEKRKGRERREEVILELGSHLWKKLLPHKTNDNKGYIV